MAHDNLPEHAYDRPDYHGTPWPGSPEARSYFTSGEWDDPDARSYFASGEWDEIVKGARRQVAADRAAGLDTHRPEAWDAFADEWMPSNPASLLHIPEVAEWRALAARCVPGHSDPDHWAVYEAIGSLYMDIALKTKEGDDQ
jgi:hypothetical protein